MEIIYLTVTCCIDLSLTCRFASYVRTVKVGICVTVLSHFGYISTGVEVISIVRLHCQTEKCNGRRASKMTTFYKRSQLPLKGSQFPLCSKNDSERQALSKRRCDVNHSVH